MRQIGSENKFAPILRYRDVAGAVDWLCEAFGFEKHKVITAVDGSIVEARLMFGNDLILLLPSRTPERGRPKSRRQAGAETQSCYLVVDDVDLHYRHAKAAGAEILDITEYDYGGRGYSCRDPQGHIWDFGTYDPWQTPTYRRAVASGVRLRTAAGLLKSLKDNINPSVVITAVVAAVIAVTTVGWVLVTLPELTPKPPESEPFEASASLQHAKEAAEHVRSQAPEPSGDQLADPPEPTTEQVIRRQRAAQEGTRRARQ